jgi:hypothetical protein
MKSGNHSFVSKTEIKQALVSFVRYRPIASSALNLWLIAHAPPPPRLTPHLGHHNRCPANRPTTKPESNPAIIINPQSMPHPPPPRIPHILARQFLFNPVSVPDSLPHIGSPADSARLLFAGFVVLFIVSTVYAQLVG